MTFTFRHGFVVTLTLLSQIFITNAVNPTPSLPVCVVESEPNPLASMFPDTVTGTINGTITVLPISYALARSIIPAQYQILSGWKGSSPKPTVSYPLIMETAIDHDIRLENLATPDFTSVRFFFPYVDLLGDGYSNFRYLPTIYLNPDLVVEQAAEAYGIKVVLSSFDPSCAGYASIPTRKPNKEDEIYFDGFKVDDTHHDHPVVNARFTTLNSAQQPLPFSLEFFKNVTNQPLFKNGLSCDNMIRFFNTTVSTGENEPVAIRGSVHLNTAEVLGSPMSFTDVFGFKIDTAFIENNYVPCASLKGYSTSG